MKKRIFSVSLALLIAFYSFPQEVIAGVFSSFHDGSAVCASLPKTAAVLNLIDISKKISIEHINTQMSSFVSYLAPETGNKPVQFSPIRDTELNVTRLYIFTGFSNVLKKRPVSTEFSAESRDPLILYDSGTLISQILLQLKSVLKASAPSDNINTIIILNKINLNPACI